MSAADDLKLPDPAATPHVEDADGDGLVDHLHPSVAWLLWCTDAATVFVRGCFAGLFPGVGGAVGGISITDSTRVDTIALNGLVGFALGVVVKGLERFHEWQAKSEHAMPNPFRAKGTP
jgi:hypothetical protein